MEISKDRVQASAKILIVDDNTSNIFLLEKLLQINGYTFIKSITDPREVLMTYICYEPDIVLLDLQMPYLDGFQVMEQLNALEQEDFVPVIIITAQSDKENRMKALQLGARDFIGKPFDSAEVVMRVSNMLEISLLQKETRLNNKLLEIKVKDRTEELHKLQLELVQRLLRAAEFRDDQTGYHVIRIGEYAAEFGRILGFDELQCENLIQASMMHDIGKIGIPDRILLKPGKLDEEEMAIMRQHTIKGAELLSGSSSQVISLAEKIALTHHERWDGKGYPQGIDSETIPLEGRITAICDVFDALLSNRPYKKAWELDRVLEVIRNEREAGFDPTLVDAFFDHLDRFLEIKTRFECDTGKKGEIYVR